MAWRSRAIGFGCIAGGEGVGRVRFWQFGEQRGYQRDVTVNIGRTGRVKIMERYALYSVSIDKNHS